MKPVYILLFLLVSAQILFPKGYKDYIIKGDSYYSKFELDSALTNYKIAYDLNPKNFDVLQRLIRVLNDLGEYYYELKDEERSEIVVYQAVDFAMEFYNLFPDSAKVYTYLAWSFGNQALFEGGKEKIKLAHKIKDNAEKAIQLDSTDYLPYIILGIYNRQVASLSWFERLLAETFFGDVPDASLEDSEKYMLKALELQPGIVIATFHLSLTYKEMDNEQKEIEALKKVLELPEVDFRDKFAKRKAKERLGELLD